MLIEQIDLQIHFVHRDLILNTAFASPCVHLMKNVSLVKFAVQICAELTVTSRPKNFATVGELIFSSNE